MRDDSVRQLPRILVEKERECAVDEVRQNADRVVRLDVGC